MTKSKEPKQTQAELEVLNVDEKLHKTIVRKFMNLISLDVVSFAIFSMVLGVFTFKGGLHPVPGIFFVLCMIGLLWNVGSLMAVMMKKYGCYLVTVDKVWEEKGVILCRITPDTYNKYDFTGELTIKNYTKKYKDVKAGDRAIVAAGKFSRYIYLFDYEGETSVTESLKFTVTENTSYAEKMAGDNLYGDIRKVHIEGVGTVTFKRLETEEGVGFEHQEGLNDSFFGPHCVISVEKCTIPEERFDDTVAAIEAAYRNSGIILEGFYDMALRTISSEGIIPPAEGEIDKVYLQEEFVIKEMYVIIYDEIMHGKDDIEINLYGNVEDANGKWLLTGKTFLININCMSGEVKFELKDF